MSAADLLKPDVPASAPRRRDRSRKTPLDRALAAMKYGRRPKDLSDDDIGAAELSTRQRLRAAGDMLADVMAITSNGEAEHILLVTAIAAAKGSEFMCNQRRYLLCLRDLFDGNPTVEDVQAAIFYAVRLIENYDVAAIIACEDEGVDFVPGLEFLKVAIYAIASANSGLSGWEWIYAGAGK